MEAYKISYARLDLDAKKVEHVPLFIQMASKNNKCAVSMSNAQTLNVGLTMILLQMDYHLCIQRIAFPGSLLNLFLMDSRAWLQRIITFAHSTIYLFQTDCHLRLRQIIKFLVSNNIKILLEINQCIQSIIAFKVSKIYLILKDNHQWFRRIIAFPPSKIIHKVAIISRKN